MKSNKQNIEKSGGEKDFEKKFPLLCERAQNHTVNPDQVKDFIRECIAKAVHTREALLEAYILIPGDHTVGVWDESFVMDVPDLSCYSDKGRESMREDIKKFYQSWCDSTHVAVMFSDECGYCGKAGHDLTKCSLAEEHKKEHGTTL